MEFEKKKKITVVEAKNLDIVFLVDTSGSMCAELEAVKKSCTDFADRIIKEKKNVRLGLIGFDIGGYRYRGVKEKPNNYQIHSLSKYTIGIWELSSPVTFKDNISSLSIGMFGGCGCYLADKDSVDIFPHVVSAFNNNNHSKILVIISDEIGGIDGLHEITKILIGNSIETYVMGVSAHSGAHESIAKETGGKFWDIHKSRGVMNFSELLRNAADEIVSSVAQKMRDAGLSEEDIEREIELSHNPTTFTFGEKTKVYSFSFGKPRYE